MNTIPRPSYISQLDQFRDVKIIKVLTGVRRAGKSMILSIYRNHLIQSGVSVGNTLQINLEDIDNSELLDYKKLHDYILAHTVPGEMNYVFIDEIQKVENFETALDSLFIRDNLDLYVTGSNAYFLSSEIATTLTGRHVEIKVYPLSFAEYVSAFPEQPRTDILFEQYKLTGALPQAVEIFKSTNQSMQAVSTYLQGVYSTLIHTDIAARLDVDSFKLDKVVLFTLDNVSNITSPQRISNTLAADGYSISRNTVEQYLNALTQGFILYQASRFDVRGKELLKTLNKYYVVDLGLRNLIIHKNTDDSGHILENIVYFELLRRYASVMIGKNNTKEIDFVCTDDMGGLTYYQVTETMLGSETRQRELGAYKNITDNYPKFVLTQDPGSNSHDGVQQVNVIDWLLSI